MFFLLYREDIERQIAVPDCGLDWSTYGFPYQMPRQLPYFNPATFPFNQMLSSCGPPQPPRPNRWLQPLSPPAKSIGAAFAAVSASFFHPPAMTEGEARHSGGIDLRFKKDDNT